MVATPHRYLPSASPASSSPACCSSGLRAEQAGQVPRGVQKRRLPQPLTQPTAGLLSARFERQCCDIVTGVLAARDNPPKTNTAAAAPHRIFNIGNNQPADLMDVIAQLEECLGRKAKKNLLPMQPGDVPETFANIDDLVRDVGFQPATPIQEGMTRFVEWYREYYGE